MSKTESKIICLGRIQKAHGFTGLVKATTFGSLLKQFKQESEVQLFRASQVKDGLLIDPIFFTKIFISVISEQNESVVLKILGVESLAAAESYKGSYLGLALHEAKQQFADLRDPYLFQYLDLDVVDKNGGEKIGVISRVEEIAGRQIFVINREDQEIMIPANCPNIISLDLEQNTIVIEDLDDFIS